MRLQETLDTLGIDRETIVLPSPAAGGEPRTMALEPTLPTLADAEWEILRDHLPPEPAQARAISNRELLEAVLWVFAQRKAWTQVAGDQGEAVRKRFARWAHAGTWQKLYETMRGGCLSPVREAQLAAVARRAGQLQSRLARRQTTD